MNTPFERYILAELPYPILGQRFTNQDFAPIDLSIENTSAHSFPLHTFSGLQDFIRLGHQETKSPVLYGGYLEKRILYQESTHFSTSSNPRNIHLGLDLWCRAGTSVYTPLSGVIHSFGYNDQPLDYGATLIVKHQTPTGHFHCLYGHLSLASISNKQIGQSLSKGEKIAEFGHPHENGGWVPHLHFQIIKDIEDMTGDYPGVCSVDQLLHFSNNCPDPGIFLSPYLSL